MKKYTAAVIGIGGQAMEDHIPALIRHPNITVTSVAEVDKQRLEKFTDKYAEVQGYSDFNRLFEKEKPDFCVITLPHNLHYEATKLALENNCNVLKEKPFAMNLPEAKALAELAFIKKLHVYVTMQRRLNPIYSTFLHLEEKIGKPFFVDVRYTFFTENPHTGWRGSRETAGGGCLIDMGYHMIDLLMWYFGLPDEISCEALTEAKEDIEYDAEDTALVNFKFNDRNLIGNMLISRVIPPKQEYLHVYGTRGIIKLERTKIERLTSSGEVVESISREGDKSMSSYDQIDNFIQILQEKKPNQSGPDMHLRHLAFIESAYSSTLNKLTINPHDLLK